MLRRWLLILGLVGLLGAAYLFIPWPRRATTKPVKSLQIAGADAGYVSSEVCAECHRETRERTLTITKPQTATTPCTGRTARSISAVTRLVSTARKPTWLRRKSILRW